jgi:hypothetical protein
VCCVNCSYSSCSLVKYMEKHKVKPESKAFMLVSNVSIRRLLSDYTIISHIICMLICSSN